MTHKVKRPSLLLCYCIPLNSDTRPWCASHKQFVFVANLAFWATFSQPFYHFFSHEYGNKCQQTIDAHTNVGFPAVTLFCFNLIETPFEERRRRFQTTNGKSSNAAWKLNNLQQSPRNNRHSSIISECVFFFASGSWEPTSAPVRGGSFSPDWDIIIPAVLLSDSRGRIVSLSRL